MECTIENHIDTKPRTKGKEYKNHFSTIVRVTEIGGAKVVGDYWMNDIDYELLKNYLDDCYVWHIAGSCSPIGTKEPLKSMSSSAVDGYEIHLLTDKEIESPWRDEGKPCPACGK